MFDPQKYVYEYLFITILITVIYAIVKCHFQIKIFDKFVYIENSSSKLTKEDIFKYLLFHVFGYMIIGYIFSNKYFASNLIQTIIIECLLAALKNCNMNEILQYDVIFTAVSSITIGMMSYYVGGRLR